MNNYLKIFFPILLSLSLMSCSLPEFKRAPLKSPPLALNLYKKALFEKNKKNYSQAEKAFTSFIQKFPHSDLADDAHIHLANIYIIKKNYPLAYKNYFLVINSDFRSDHLLEALIYGSYTLTQMGRLKEALKINTQALKTKNLTEKESLNIYRIRLRILNHSKEFLSLLKTLIYLHEKSPSSQKRSEYRLQAIEIAEGKLSDKEKKAIAKDPSYTFVRPYVMFSLGNTYLENKNFSLAKKYFQKLTQLDTENDLTQKSSDLIKQITALKKVSPYTIGVVLPLTGQHAKLSQKILNGLQLGLGIYDSEPTQFKLAVVDSEGNPDTAQIGVQRLIQEDHVIAIVGSLLSKTSFAVAKKAHELGIPNITLSQKNNVTQIGDSIFRNATTSYMQIKQLVHVAMKDLGFKRFAILYPNDSYGVESANLFWDEVLSHGGEIRSAISYRTKETDFRNHIQRMVGTFYVQDRLNEYRLRVKEWAQLQNRRSLRKEKIPSDLLPPVVDFEAVFIPDGVKALGQIVPMLAYNDVEKVQLLGTNLWDTPYLTKRIGALPQAPIFIGDYPKINQIKNTSMYQKFLKTFGHPPGVFEVQAYETGLLLRQTIVLGARSRERLKNQLQNTKLLPGVTGPLQISSQREIIRPLSVLTLSKSKIVEFDLSKRK